MAENHPIPTDPRFLDLTGTRKGHIFFLHYVGRINKLHTWRCRCDCGNEFEESGKSAGRKRREYCGHRCPLYRAHKAAGKRTHGMRYTSEYRAWRSMRERCHKPGSHNYELYGGIGRAVCLGWRDSFEAFFADLGKKPSRLASLDRIDNEQGYDCGHCEDCKVRGATANCRWADDNQQARNRRGNRKLTCWGEHFVSQSGKPGPASMLPQSPIAFIEAGQLKKP